MAEDNGFAMGYALGQDSGGGSQNGGFGGFGEGIWAVIILAMLFGRGGFGGGFGGYGGTGGGDCGYPCATQADVRAAVDQQTLISKIDQQTYGIADTFTALNNSLNSNFRGVDNAICSLGFNMQQGFNTNNVTMLQGFNGVERGFCDLSHQLSDCCCKTQSAIQDVRYDMARESCDTRNLIQTTTRDLIDAQNANTRHIMDFLVNSKIEKLQSENEALRLRASQADQNATLRAAIDASTAEIIRRTGNECPVPAYVVPNPNCCYGNPLGVGYSGYGSGYGFSRDGGCGCGC